MLSLEENTVKMSAKASAEFNCYIMAAGIIDSGASTTFATATEKASNAIDRKRQLRIANEQKCYKTMLVKHHSKLVTKQYIYQL